MTGARRIEQALRDANAAGRLGFVPYVTAGDPDLATTWRVTAMLAETGADVLELAVPWSDPLADGPVNQRAAERALASGTDLAGILRGLPDLRRTCAIPILLFTYVNPILRFGLDDFAAAAADAGVDGVLVTDLPPEEAGPHRAALERHGLATVFLATPTSTDDRLETVARASTGFVYAVARTGVTGPHTDVSDATVRMLHRIRSHTDLPVALGFGISGPDQVAALRGHADAFVVGSALVDALHREGASGNGLETVAERVRALVRAGQSR